MQDFGRSLIRQYLAPPGGAGAQSFSLPPAWQDDAEVPLIWNDPPQGAAPAESPIFETPPLDIPPAAAPPVASPPARRSRPAVQRKPDPEEKIDPRLLAVLAAHQEREAHATQVREERKAAAAAADIQRQVEEGQPGAQPPSRRRNRASFDYVETKTLRPPEEEIGYTSPPKAPPADTIQADRLPAQPKDDDDSEDSSPAEGGITSDLEMDTFEQPPTIAAADVDVDVVASDSSLPPIPPASRPVQRATEPPSAKPAQQPENRVSQPPIPRVESDFSAPDETESPIPSDDQSGFSASEQPTIQRFVEPPQPSSPKSDIAPAETAPDQPVHPQAPAEKGEISLPGFPRVVESWSEPNFEGYGEEDTARFEAESEDSGEGEETRPPAIQRQVAPSAPPVEAVRPPESSRSPAQFEPEESPDSPSFQPSAPRLETFDADADEADTLRLTLENTAPDQATLPPGWPESYSEPQDTQGFSPPAFEQAEFPSSPSAIQQPFVQRQPDDLPPEQLSAEEVGMESEGEAEDIPFMASQTSETVDDLPYSAASPDSPVVQRQPDVSYPDVSYTEEEAGWADTEPSEDREPSSFDSPPAAQPPQISSERRTIQRQIEPPSTPDYPRMEQSEEWDGEEPTAPDQPALAQNWNAQPYTDEAAGQGDIEFEDAPVDDVSSDTPLPQPPVTRHRPEIARKAVPRQEVPPSYDDEPFAPDRPAEEMSHSESSIDMGEVSMTSDWVAPPENRPSHPERISRKSVSPEAAYQPEQPDFLPADEYSQLDTPDTFSDQEYESSDQSDLSSDEEIPPSRHSVDVFHALVASGLVAAPSSGRSPEIARKPEPPQTRPASASDNRTPDRLPVQYATKPGTVMRAITAEETPEQPEQPESSGDMDINIDKLARDVYSALRNRLRVEKERRGSL